MSDAEAPASANGDGSKMRRRAYAAYRWIDRLQWLTSLYRSPSEIALATASAGVVATVGGMTINDALVSRRNAMEPSAAVKTVRETKNSTVFEVIGFDATGRRGVFDVVAPNKEFMWMHASAAELEQEGYRFTSAEVAGDVVDDEVRQCLSQALQVVAVGTSSQEGNPTEELHRAGLRAVTTADVVQNAAAPATAIWALNLGQYRDQCTACETSGTSWQRPFIVIAVKQLENNAVLGETLADAMSGKTRLPTPENHSAFALTKIR